MIICHGIWSTAINIGHWRKIFHNLKYKNCCNQLKHKNLNQKHKIRKIKNWLKKSIKVVYFYNWKDLLTALSGQYANQSNLSIDYAGKI